MREARRVSRRIAGERDERLVRARGEQAKHLELRGVEFVKAVHDEQPPAAREPRIVFQRERGEPALSLAIRPIGREQAFLVRGVESREFFQPRA